MDKKYLYFDKMFGPMFSKVLILVHESLQEMESFEDEWWKNEERTTIGNAWVSCVDYNSYKKRARKC